MSQGSHHRRSRAAVIDIGSNTIKMLVAEAGEGRKLETIAERTLETRISADKPIQSPTPPNLSEEAMGRASQAVAQLLKEAQAHQPDCLEIVATSAVREAGNAHGFREAVQQATGHNIRILDGEEEARGIAAGVATDPALADLSAFLLMDIGGGSLELIEQGTGHLRQLRSLPLGAVRLKNSFLDDPERPISENTRERIREHVRQCLAESGFQPPRHEILVGTGGAFALSRLLLAIRQGKHHLAEHPPLLEASQLSSLAEQLCALSLSERSGLPGLPTSRADILPVALLTILTLLEAFNLHKVHHSLRNLRYGRAARLLDIP